MKKKKEQKTFIFNSTVCIQSHTDRVREREKERVRATNFNYLNEKNSNYTSKRVVKATKKKNKHRK